MQPARQRHRAQDRRVGPATPARRTPGAARGGRRSRCARRGRAPAAARRARAASPRRGGAASTIACVIPVKRWMPRDSGARTPTSVSQRSCSSPPPTSTAPTSVSSHASPREAVGLGVDDEELRGPQGDGRAPREGPRAPGRTASAVAPGFRGPARPDRRAEYGASCTASGRRHAMTASAPHHTPAPERAGREREAWDAYRASLRDLEGKRLRGGGAHLLGAAAAHAGDARGRRPELTAAKPAFPDAHVRGKVRAGSPVRHLWSRVGELRMQSRTRRGNAALAAALAVAVVAAGCGGRSRRYVNKPRPASKILISGSINTRAIAISPTASAPGRSTCSSRTRPAPPQRVTLESLDQDRPGLEQQTAPINPQDTARLSADVRRAATASPSTATASAPPSSWSAARARARRTSCSSPDGRAPPRRPPGARGSGRRLAVDDDRVHRPQQPLAPPRPRRAARAAGAWRGSPRSAPLALLARSGARAGRPRRPGRRRPLDSAARGARPTAAGGSSRASSGSHMTTLTSVSLKSECSLRFAEPIVSQRSSTIATLAWT